MPIFLGRMEESGQYGKHPRSKESCDPEPWQAWHRDISVQLALHHSWLKVDPARIHFKLEKIDQNHRDRRDRNSFLRNSGTVHHVLLFRV